MIRPERVLRADLGTLGDREAAELLQAMAKVVTYEVASVRAAVWACPGIDEDDLTAVAKIAVLEARVTWVEGKGRSLRSWVQQLVRWRLGETLQASQQPGEVVVGAGADFDAAVAPLQKSDVGAISGWSAAKFAEVFARTMAELPEKDRILVEQAVAGVSRAETARQLARGYTEVCHTTTAVLRRLQQACAPVVGKR